MADNVTYQEHRHSGSAPAVGTSVATNEIEGAHFQKVKIVLGADGHDDGTISSSNSFPVTGPLTDTELRASDVKVSLDSEVVTVTGPLTDTQLRADDVKVSLDSEVVSVTGPLTDTQLRASDVKITLDGEQVQVLMKTGDSTYQVPRVDVATHALKAVLYEHSEIHNGDSFTTCHQADTASGSNLDVLIVTPNTTKWGHLTYEYEGELETDLAVYEGTSTSNNGTALDVFNRDRNSATANGILVYHTPTVTGVGTKIRCWHTGSGRNFGGSDRGTHEFILKQNTKYLFRLNNASSQTGWISLKVDWYEHTNRTA